MIQRSTALLRVAGSITGTVLIFVWPRGSFSGSDCLYIGRARVLTVIYICVMIIASTSSEVKAPMSDNQSCQVASYNLVAAEIR